MTDQPIPNFQHLPTSKQLWKATGIAVVVAIVLLVTIVMPAEFGIDPTRIGGLLGLDKMSQAATTDSPTASVAAAPTAPVAQRDAAYRTDSTTLTLAPGKGTEIKATMKAGEQFSFSWKADGGPVNFDMHGERPNAGSEFTSYWKDRQKTAGHGSFVAPFDGTHGWFWGNKSDKPVTITLSVAGYYEKLGKP